VPPGPRRTPAWLERLEPLALTLLGDRRVVRIRAVMEGYGRAGGGLLAAGIAFNALFALIPLAIFISGLIGLIVSDPGVRAAVTELISDLAPPLAAFLDAAVGGLASVSPSLSIIGLVGTAWGTTRLYASIELGVQAMFTGVKARNLLAKTLRRIAFVLVIAATVGAAIVVSTVGTIIGGAAASVSGVFAVLGSIALLVLPFILSVLAIGVLYRFVPPVRPPLEALAPPAIAVGLLVVAITQVFALIAPRLVGVNVFYGTLGTVFAALAWLNINAVILLLGAAWVRVRMLTDEEIAASV
jgi:membrane protein